MNFSSVFALLLTLSLASPLLAAAAPHHGNVYQSFEAGKSARAARPLSGRIDAVDYAGNTIVVRGVIVAVTPSTSIARGRENLTFSDLRPGQNVEIMASIVDGRLIAQVITVK